MHAHSSERVPLAGLYGQQHGVPICNAAVGQGGKGSAGHCNAGQVGS